MKIKRAAALLIVFSIILCMCPNVFADSKEEYGVLPLSWFTMDETDNLPVMIKDGHVYAEARSLGEKLGYIASGKDQFFTMVKKTSSIKRVVRFTDGSDDVFYFNGLFSFDYDMPCKAVKNDHGFWVPFVYVLRLLDSGYIPESSMVTSPSETLLGTYVDIMSNSSKYIFDIIEDLGDSYARLGTCELINIWNGWLSLDLNYLNTSMMDTKYFQDAAMLFCTLSQDEIRSESKMLTLGSGALASIKDIGEVATNLNEHYQWEVGEVTKLIEFAKKQSASSAEMEQLYNTLNKAVKNEEVSSELSKIFNTASEKLNVELIDKGFTGVTLGLEFASYYIEFQEQDKTSLNAMKAFTKDLKKNDPVCLSDHDVKILNDYINTSEFQSEMLKYSLIKTLKNNASSAIKLFTAKDLQKYLFGTQGCLVLLGWNLASEFIPSIKNGLDNTEKSQLALYLQVLQSEAYHWSIECREKAVNNPDSKEAWTKYAQSTYTFLKMCHITRQNGMDIIDTYLKNDRMKEADLQKKLKNKSITNLKKKRLTKKLEKIQSEIKIIEEYKETLEAIDLTVAEKSSLYYNLSQKYDDCDFTAFFGMIPPEEAKVKKGYDELDKLIAEKVITGYQPVELTKKEKNSIARILTFLTDESFDCAASDEIDNAMWLALNPVTGLWWSSSYAVTKNKLSSYNHEEKGFKKDPLNAFSYNADNYTIGYYQFDGDAVDWILKNILNVTPVHSSTSSFMTSALNGQTDQFGLYYYYYKGAYYVEMPGGLGGWEGYGISFDKVLFNGLDYQIRYKRQYASWQADEGYDTDYPIDTAYTTCKKNAVDGKEYWSVLRLSETSYFDFSAYPDDESEGKWRQLYIDFIRNNIVDENSECCLVYINDDDIPELLINRSIVMADGSVVATVYNNKLTSREVWPYGITYIERKNSFLESGGRMDQYYDYVYKIDKGSFVKTASGEYGLEDESVYDRINGFEEYEKYYVYRWNGSKVSPAQYRKNLQLAFQQSSASEPKLKWTPNTTISRLDNNFIEIYPVYS